MPVVTDVLDLPPGRCTCGMPSLANYYVSLIVGRDVTPDGLATETQEADGYYCAEHVPAELAEGEMFEYEEEGQPQQWYVREFKATHLRGDV